MDHTYSFFDEPIPDSNNHNIEDVTLNAQDKLMSKLLSASDFMCSDDLENAEEVLIDIKEVTENNQEE